MMQPWENGKNSNFRPSLGPQKFFPWVLPRQWNNVPSYQPMQCSGKLMNQTLKKKKKQPNFGPDFGPFDPPNFFCRFYLN